MTEIIPKNQQESLHENQEITNKKQLTARKPKAKSSLDSNMSAKILNQKKTKDQDHFLTVRFNKKLQNLKLQTQLHKLQKYIETEKKIQRNKQILSQIQQQLNLNQELAKKHKRQLINSRIKQMKKRSQSRREYIIKSNHQLQQIKHFRQVIKEQIDKKMQQEKQEYDRLYKEALEKRKQTRKRVDFGVIRDHEEKYLKNSTRLKTDQKQQSNRSASKRYDQIADSFIQQTQQEKRKRLAQMFKKRKQYGNKVQKQKRNVRVRVKTQNIKEQRQKESAKKFEKMMQFRQQLAKLKKPPLQSRGDWYAGSVKQIKRLKKTKDISVPDKIEKLNNLAQGYRVHFQNGKQQALSLISEVTLAKAQLLLYFEKEETQISNRSQTLKY